MTVVGRTRYTSAGARLVLAVVVAIMTAALATLWPVLPAAAQSAPGEPAAVESAAHEPAVTATRPSPYPPCVGLVRSVCLLVDFADEPATIPPDEVAAFLNGEGYAGFGNNGSVRDYWREVTNGRLDLEHVVPTTYYRARRPRRFYDDPQADGENRVHLLLTEALEDLDRQGWDFSRFDCNGDGHIDNITLLYAGNRNPHGGLWPHSNFLDRSYDGVATLRYVVCDVGDPPTLALLVHELGHALGGFPDLYDYGGDSRGAGLYCLMNDSSPRATDPVDLSAFCRRLAGWCDLVELTPDLRGRTLTADAHANTVFYYPNPDNPREYFLIENRHRSGRDHQLPGSGLAIWHIDQDGCNDFQEQTREKHYLTTLVQADGRRDLERNVNQGDVGDLWGGPERSECSPRTAPNTDWWDGSPSGLRLAEISEPAVVMTFVFAE